MGSSCASTMSLLGAVQPGVTHVLVQDLPSLPKAIFSVPTKGLSVSGTTDSPVAWISTTSSLLPKIEQPGRRARHRHRARTERSTVFIFVSFPGKKCLDTRAEGANEGYASTSRSDCPFCRSIPRRDSRHRGMA